VVTYTAICRRSGAWWAISVPDLKGLHTQVRRLADAEATARDAMALLLDVDRGSFAVVISPEVPEAAAQ
jgi:predicted RNase H-like HicB family nuclease